MGNADGMKLGKRDNPEKTHKIPALSTTFNPLATPTLELGTTVRTDERTTAHTPGRLPYNVNFKLLKVE